MCIEPMAEQDVCNMCYIVLLKIVQHPILLNELLNGTGEIIDNGYVNPFGEDTLIIEDVSFRMGGSGLFWGAAKIPNSEMWAGYNILGEIFMFLRNLINENPLNDLPSIALRLKSPETNGFMRRFNEIVLDTHKPH